MKRIFSILSLFVAISTVMVSCSSDDDTVALSTLTAINDFSIAIDGVNADDITYDLGNTIAIEVPFGTSLTTVVPTIGISENATVTPNSGSEVTFVDGEAKTFIVTAEDGTTAKEYSVVINIRAEVGNGTQLLTYQIADLFGENSITTYSYNESNFVSSYTKEINDFGDINTVEYILVYDDKNQVLEKKSADSKSITVYEYNDEGQIVKGKYSFESELTYTYEYSYDANGALSSEKRTDHTSDDAVTEVKFTIEEGNVVLENRFSDDYIATYDDKNNPFKGLYPAAYAAINAGITAVNTNNPISGTLADGAITYEYNTDNYPIKASYTYFDGLASVEKNYTY
ncbi:hypothetical protein [Maribacter ulvicola]|uniref:YD repeat-containing protein n=1 Tax=Maribacter ulvicola TaxID=228959 RepID=A0A1N6PD90_9FLAO|nr:hypothetical protein [Maribacter ulvicola]SIQ02274.1 YD repeat-containing protein [Maribacter ulvicola]